MINYLNPRITVCKNVEEEDFVEQSQENVDWIIRKIYHNIWGGNLLQVLLYLHGH